MLPSLSGWAVKNWLPILLQDHFAMDQKTSGLWATDEHGAGGDFRGAERVDGLSDLWMRGNVHAGGRG